MIMTPHLHRPITRISHNHARNASANIGLHRPSRLIQKIFARFHPSLLHSALSRSEAQL
jgi:hypothetical protein